MESTKPSERSHLKRSPSRARKPDQTWKQLRQLIERTREEEREACARELETLAKEMMRKNGPYHDILKGAASFLRKNGRR